jgi:hypothetical protein
MLRIHVQRRIAMAPYLEPSDDDEDDEPETPAPLEKKTSTGYGTADGARREGAAERAPVGSFEDGALTVLDLGRVDAERRAYHTKR